MTTPRGIRWVSWPPGDGYGDAAVGYVRALDALGVPVTWTPLTWPPGAPRAIPSEYRRELEHLAHRSIEHDVVVVHLPADMGHDLSTTVTGDHRAVLYTTWELDRVPPEWQRHCEAFDAVVVPSTFNRDALSVVSPRMNVHVVPHCARPVAATKPAPPDRLGDRFVFYTIGPWSTRKAVADTVRAFLDAFGKDDDVALVVKTSERDQQAVARLRRRFPPDHEYGLELSTVPAFAALLSGRRNPPDVELIARQISRQEIDALHLRGDCFVSLTRSEGFGLCIADALLSGNPVVVTGWGGHLDYLGRDYPLLVEYDLIPTSEDVRDDWFETRAGYRWARARHEHAVEQLRWVANHREEAVTLSAHAGARIAREHAPDVIGRRLLSALAPR